MSKETIELAIETLAERNQVEAWVLRGLMEANNWGSGKVMTEKEFLAKRDAWLNGPMCRV